MDKKVAVVTGGAQGIGLGIVKKLVSRGFFVYILDKDEKKCLDVKQTFLKEVEYIIVDLTNDKDVVSAFNTIKASSRRLDVLVCDAGITIRKWAFDYTMEDYDKVLNINLRAYYLCAKTAAEIMKDQNSKGNIVCISSANSVVYHSQRSLYNISKAAINGMVGTLGVEFARFGIRINAVAPGYVLTELLEKGIKDGIIDEKNIMSVIPMKRYIHIEEIANVVYFLATDESSGITGQVLFVDGGWSKNALPEE